MARRKRRVGEIGTTTLLLIGGAVLVVGFVVMQKSSTPTTTIIKPPPTSSAGLTAAEITAGAGVVNTLINDLTPDDSDS
jgi:hypothetical protein